MYSLATTIDHLQQTIKGEVTSAPEATSQASFDFGRIVVREPELVVTPMDSRDVSHLLDYANRHRIPVSTQGASHTQGGHSLNSKGIALRTID